MSTAGQNKLKLDEVLSNHNSAGLLGYSVILIAIILIVLASGVESIKRAIIKTSKSEAQVPYTILLVGEPGVGKSSVLEFIANVLAGNDIDNYNFDILDHTNEQGGPNNQSQTSSAQLYEVSSVNGTVVRILDTPGLAHTRGLQQDELHKQSIEMQIKNHIDSINAVLVLVNGTVPRVTVGTHYALSTLSAIFPKSLANKIAFLLTNTSNPLFQNFSADALPEGFKDAPQFLLNNPIALHRRYLELTDVPNTIGQVHIFRDAVKASEQDALEMLGDLLVWLDVGPPPKKPQNAGANAIGPLAKQMGLLRKVMERGLRKIRAILIG